MRYVFNGIADQFEGLIKVASTAPSFHPNEADMTADALNARIQELRKLSTKVIVQSQGFNS